MTIKLKTGDMVSVRVGKNRGKTGKVIQVLRDEGRVAVEGINQLTKHVRAPQRTGSQKGQKVTFWGPINVSNVLLVCPKCSKVTRVGAKILGDGKKARLCKKCGEVL